MDQKLTFILLGHTGAGKSASGNTILGEVLFESRRAFKSVTTQISEKSKVLYGKQISVIDTPGILCPGFEDKIKTYCQALLQSSTLCLFLVVIKIDRFTDEQKNAVTAAMRVIGDQELRNSFLLFTRGDDLGSMTVEDFIKEDPDGALPKLAERFDGRYHVFNNKGGGQKQVEKLLDKRNQLQTNEQGSHSQDTVCSSPVLEERRLVLLGLVGAGKSASGNTILESTEFQSSCSFNSVTSKCVYKSARVEGRQVTVFDTPGYNGLSASKLETELKRMIDLSRPGPHALILVVKLGRVSKADCLMLEYLPKMFGSYASKYSMVLFTHADQLNGQSLEDVIQSNEHVSKMVSMCANRYCVFDNKKRSNRLQVRSLLDKVDQILRTNGGHCPSDKLKFEPFKNKDGFFQTLVQLIKWLIMKIKELLASVVEYGFQSTRVIQHTALASIGMRRSIQSPLQSRVSPCSSLNVL